MKHQPTLLKNLMAAYNSAIDDKTQTEEFIRTELEEKYKIRFSDFEKDRYTCVSYVNFILVDSNGNMPVSQSLDTTRELTNNLEKTPVFCLFNDNPEIKINYFNAIYKGITEFQTLCF